MSADVNDVQAEWFAEAGAAAMRALGFEAGQRVIDFGCGPGRFSAPLSRVVAGDGGGVIAVDRSEKALADLRGRLAACGEAEAVEPTLAESDNGLLELACKPVDAILAFDVLQHVKDWPGFFDAAAAALKPTGRLVIYPAATPHPGTVDMNSVRDLLAARGFGEIDTRRLRLPHAESMCEDVVHLFARDEA